MRRQTQSFPESKNLLSRCIDLGKCFPLSEHYAMNSTLLTQWINQSSRKKLSLLPCFQKGVIER